MGKQRKKYTEEQITQILKEAEVSNNVSDTLRKELLRGVELEKWREKYNNERPHSALNYEPPSSWRRPHGGDGKENKLESIKPINNNINQVNLLP